MKVKEQIKDLKESEIVQEALNKIRPTWHVIKNEKGYKIIIISMLISLIFLPLNSLIKLIAKILMGGTVISAAALPEIIKSAINGYSYFEPELIVMGLLVIIVTSIISFLTFIITTFLVSNANFRCFRVLAEEERIISVGEYFKLAFYKLIPYSLKLFIHVLLPVFIIRAIGWAINFIPYIKGNSIANVVASIFSYALMFRFIAIIIELDGDEMVREFTNYWLTFAIIVWLIKLITSLTILTTFFDMMFILYSLLLLTGSRYYYED